MTNANRFTPYPPPPFPLWVPEPVWEKTLEEVKRYRNLCSEALVFWGGVIAGETGVVTGLYLPGHLPQGARAALTAEEARWLVRQLRERDEKLLAQVHSHPGEAYHSHGDDRHATSYHPGAYSIVVPGYGRDPASLADCAVHVVDGDSFQLVDRNAARGLVRMIPSIEARLREPIDPQNRRLGRRWWSWLASKLRPKPTDRPRP